MFSKKFDGSFFSRDKTDQMRAMLLEVGKFAHRVMSRARIPDRKREELVQEVLFDISNIPLEKSIENPKAYVKQIVRSKVAKYSKKKKELEPKRKEYERVMKATYTDRSLSQVESLLTKEKHQSLLDKIYLLPPPEPVVMLCAIGFQSCITPALYEESASQLEIDMHDLESRIK